MSFQYSDAVIMTSRDPLNTDGLPSIEWSHGLKWWTKSVFVGLDGTRRKYENELTKVQYPDGRIVDSADGDGRPRCIWYVHSSDEHRAKFPKEKL